MNLIKVKKFTTVLTVEDYLDVSLYFEKNRIIKFALNYRGRIGKKWHPIYRVDNFHGFLHEQRFWRTKDLIPLIDEERKSNERIIEEYTEKIVMNFRKYKEYFKKSGKGGKI